ncbi:MAG: amidase family protein [Nostoc sp.]|uniref:amidase family protein n=1 Tax=Nostoc sp. TaxID=1180 RepID=UPI002FF7C47E
MAETCSFQLEETTIAEINMAFDARALTSQQLTQLYLNRIHAYNNHGPRLNAINTINLNALETSAALDLERQSTGKRSLLHGIPVFVKDNYDTFDLPTTAGSVLLKDSIPPDDAFLVKQLREPGAVILGKTAMSEWAWIGAKSLIGITVNPYKLNRAPTGSSSGRGVAIAANFAVVATGSDTGGSIRNPSAVNALVGIKPTLGLTSRDGIIPLAPAFDVGGPITRTVTDAAITLGIMTGIDVNHRQTYKSEAQFYKDYTQFLDQNALRSARIGVVEDFFGSNKEIDDSIRTAIAILKELGAIVIEPIHYPEKVLAVRTEVHNRVIYTEFKSKIADYLITLEDKYPKTFAEIFALSKSHNGTDSQNQDLLELFESVALAGSLSDPAYLDAIDNGIPLIRNAIREIMDSYNLDALVYPTRRCPPYPLPFVVDPSYVCEDGLPASNFANITGFPEINVPTGWTEDGIPISISFFGRACNEPILLGFAYAYEQATKYRRPHNTTPPLPGEVIEYTRVATSGE